jgi:hypothetical protein
VLRLGLVIALASLIAATSASARPNSPPLKRFSPPHGGYSVLLPSNWLFIDASYPSDHATHLWWAPRNALMKLEVVVSGCVGCASIDNYKVPNPAGLVPPGAIGKQRINKWEDAYQSYGTDDPYPDNGIVIVTHQGSRITGWARFDLWLPASEHTTASAILNSVRLG